jgi:hypothetical protein
LNRRRTARLLIGLYFTGVAVPFYRHWLHADTLPMFRAMDAALVREVASHG